MLPTIDFLPFLKRVACILINPFWFLYAFLFHGEVAQPYCINKDKKKKTVDRNLSLILDIFIPCTWKEMRKEFFNKYFYLELLHFVGKASWLLSQNSVKPLLLLACRSIVIYEDPVLEASHTVQHGDLVSCKAGAIWDCLFTFTFRCFCFT